jgi:pimeloyl-ACP methyl ester carboxylesterase
VTASHSAAHLAYPIPLYCEHVDPGGSQRPPIVLVHGGGFTGSCYLTTPDGRPGWAYDFARQGYEVFVPDWPGVGRSAALPTDQVSGAVVVDALGTLLQHLGQPVVLLVHSMSGPYGFQLMETCGDLVCAMVAIAPGPPGNIQSLPVVVRETDREIEIVTPSAPLILPKSGSWYPTMEFVRRKLVGSSTRLSADLLPDLLAVTTPIPSQCLLERLNYRGQQLTVTNRDHFTDLPILVMTGSADGDHSRRIDQETVDWLRSLGAKVDYDFLGDQQIVGNGHMLMSEENSDDLACRIARWLGQVVPTTQNM